MEQDIWSRDDLVLITSAHVFVQGEGVEMQNEAGEFIDIYIPRKCSSSGRIIGAKDHASVQISVAEVNETGTVTGTSKSYAICGFIRSLGESDDAINRLATKDKIATGLTNLE